VRLSSSGELRSSSSGSLDNCWSSSGQIHFHRLPSKVTFNQEIGHKIYLFIQNYINVMLTSSLKSPCLFFPY
jgi:hypothetical protein